MQKYNNQRVFPCIFEQKNNFRTNRADSGPLCSAPYSISQGISFLKHDILTKSKIKVLSFSRFYCRGNFVQMQRPNHNLNAPFLKLSFSIIYELFALLYLRFALWWLDLTLLSGPDAL